MSERQGSLQAMNKPSNKPIS